MKAYLRILWDRLPSAAYTQRLWSSLPLLLFILLLQSLQSIHLLSESPFTDQGPVVLLSFFAKCTFRSILWASLAWWIVALPTKRSLRYILAGIILTLVSLLHLFEGYLLGTQGVGFNYAIASIFAATNPAETSEFLSSALTLSPFLRPLLELLLVLSLSSLFYRLVTSKSTSQGGGITLTKSILYTSTLISLINLGYAAPRSYDRILFFGIPQDYTLSPTDRVIWNSYAVYKEARQIQGYAQNLKHISLGNLHLSNPYGQINVVIIIGESLRRDYMHCYGYPLSNTPHLDSLITSGNIAQFWNVTSPSTNTIASLTEVLTLKTIQQQGSWHQYPTLTNILSRCNYTTYWASNQECVGSPLQPLNTIAKLADETTFIQSRSLDGDNEVSGTKPSYDEGLFPHLHYSDSKHPHIAQFIHLLGSHLDYRKRYPESFARFTAEDIRKVSGQGAPAMIAQYINTIYYNDYVVSEIIKRYQDQPTLLFYFSDHGEALYDVPGKPDFIGHSVAHRSNVEIPFLVYVSPSLQQRAPELLPLIRSRRDVPFVNDLFTNSLLQLLGIQTKYSDPRLELFSEGYDQSRPQRATNLGQLFDVYPEKGEKPQKQAKR